MNTTIGHITLITENDTIIDEDVEADVQECFSNCRHPFQKLNDRIRQLINKQDELGDPIASISSKRFSDEDLIGDEGYAGIC